MSEVVASLRRIAGADPRRPAVHGDSCSLDYGRLHAAVCRLAKTLDTSGLRSVALIADNGVSWVAADLADVARTELPARVRLAETI